MSKFTKSEWNFSYVQRLQDIAEKEDGKYLVVKINGTPTEEELQALSRLLSAAPEMYDTLNLCFNVLYGHYEFAVAQKIDKLLARIN